MVLVDFDGLFDEKLSEYMEMNKGKYSEKQWENLIPNLYKKFGDTYVAKVKCTPVEYYAKMTDTELVQTLKAHLEEKVPVPEFLCDEIENRKPTAELLSLLDSSDSETVLYAINLLGSEPCAFEKYFALMTGEKFDVDVWNELVDNLKENADLIKETAFSYLKKGIKTEYMLEILSRVSVPDENVYTELLNAFEKDFFDPAKNALHASYLSAYGDERALKPLLKRIDSPEIGFVEFQELKFAIEALGGTYDKPRDFSTDNDYLAVENASEKEGFATETRS